MTACEISPSAPPAKEQPARTFECASRPRHRLSRPRCVSGGYHSRTMRTDQGTLNRQGLGAQDGRTSETVLPVSECVAAVRQVTEVLRMHVPAKISINQDHLSSHFHYRLSRAVACDKDQHALKGFQRVETEFYEFENVVFG